MSVNVRDVLVTALLCFAAAVMVLRRQERRHERDMHQVREFWREAAWQQGEGIPPPGHPDWETALTDDEVDDLEDIEARFHDVGLAILDGEGDER